MARLGLLNKLNRFLNKFGYEINPKYTTANFFEIDSIDLVLDIGANKGQFVEKLRNQYRQKIISFEPLTSAHNYISQISRNDKNWIIYDRVAVGDIDEYININISEHSACSSVMTMLKTHSDNKTNSEFIGSEPVQCIRLSTIWNELVGDAKAIFIKVDVQGYEDHVLSGIGSTIDDVRIKYFQIELSCVELYQGQKLNTYFHSFFNKHGFKVVKITPAFFSTSGELLQYDVIFKRVQ